MYNTVAKAPRRAPKTAPASITPSVWSVIGTAMPAIVTAGVSANTAIRAAKVEIRARPLMPVRVVVVVNAPAAERSFWPASLIAEIGRARVGKESQEQIR